MTTFQIQPYSTRGRLPVVYTAGVDGDAAALAYARGIHGADVSVARLTYAAGAARGLFVPIRDARAIDAAFSIA